MSQGKYQKFFDDAAVFPPGLAPLPDAVANHVRIREDEVATEFVGPLILPLKDIEEAIALAGEDGVDFSVIAPVSKLKDVQQLRIRMIEEFPQHIIAAAELKLDQSLEEALEAIATFRHNNPEIPVFLELSAEELTADAYDALKEAGVGLKFRTGGIEQNLFPSPDELITVIAEAVDRDLPFKLTAGLHRAMRYTDEKTGFKHFGFANIAAAVAALRAGKTKDEAKALLENSDEQAVTSTLAGDSDWRSSFKSFGTCSLTEPMETLESIDEMPSDVVARF